MGRGGCSVLNILRREHTGNCLVLGSELADELPRLRRWADQVRAGANGSRIWRMRHCEPSPNTQQSPTFPSVFSTCFVRFSFFGRILDSVEMLRALFGPEHEDLVDAFCSNVPPAVLASAQVCERCVGGVGHPA